MAKRKSVGFLDRLSDQSLAPLLLSPLSLVVLFMVGAVLLSISLWNRFHDQINFSADAPLSTQTLVTTPTPTWIKVDVEEEAIQQNRLDQIRITHPGAVQKVVEAFSVHPWIASVQKVEKKPAGIFVELNYRRPVAMVEVDHGGLVPIDGTAVVLNGELFSDTEKSEYLRISVRNPRFESLVYGAIWNDLRIRDAAQIAMACEEHWRSLGLVRVMNASHLTNDEMRLAPFVLVTLTGTAIIWGRAPGKELTGEASAEEKLVAIVEYVKANGPLDQSAIRTLEVINGKMKPSTTVVAFDMLDQLQLN